MNKKKFLVLVVLLAALAAEATWLVLNTDRGLEVLDRSEVMAYRVEPTSAPTLVLVVMDTVRADHLSACGYERPTSPGLESLVARGAQLSCRAYAPGSWTLSSHASLFTGLEVVDHGADFGKLDDPDASVLSAGHLVVRPLGPEVPTLAEQLRERGYQAHMVSANPVVSEVTGLARGFDSVRVGDFRDWYDGVLARHVRRTLHRDVRRDGTPLFLFVNVCDAHQPFLEIPPGVGWVPPREEIRFRYEPGSVWYRYVTGEMQGEEREQFLEHLVDVYDHAVYRSDTAVTAVMEQLELHGWLDGDYRVVVTGDHGELLGEHGLIHHMVYLYEGTSRVPLLYLQQGGEYPDLSEPIAGLEAYHLLLDGALAGRPLRATGQPNLSMVEESGGAVGGVTSAAEWGGRHKHLWMDGQTTRYDVVADPGEEHGEPVPPGPDLEDLAGANTAMGGRVVEQDPALLELLRAAGYVGDP